MRLFYRLKLLSQVKFNFILFLLSLGGRLRVAVSFTLGNLKLGHEFLIRLLQCLVFQLRLFNNLLTLILNPLIQLLVVSFQVGHALLSILRRLLLLLASNPLQILLFFFEPSITLILLGLQTQFLIAEELHLVFK